eukprot:2822143-Rhodomonas_salina.1
MLLLHATTAHQPNRSAPQYHPTRTLQTRAFAVQKEVLSERSWYKTRVLSELVWHQDKRQANPQQEGALDKTRLGKKWIGATESTLVCVLVCFVCLRETERETERERLIDTNTDRDTDMDMDMDMDTGRVVCLVSRHVLALRIARSVIVIRTYMCWGSRQVVPSTELAYAQARNGLSGLYDRIQLCYFYAMPGTDLAHGTGAAYGPVLIERIVVVLVKSLACAVAGHRRYKIRIFNVANGSEVKTLDGHYEIVYDMQFTFTPALHPRSPSLCTHTLFHLPPSHPLSSFPPRASALACRSKFMPEGHILPALTIETTHSAKQRASRSSQRAFFAVGHGTGGDS